jgi:hypothetical protein
LEEFTTLHLYAEDYDPLQFWQLATWCKKQGATEWTMTVITVTGAETALFDRFEEVTREFHLPKARRRQVTAYKSAAGADDFIRPTELWRLTSKSFAVLQKFMPDGLFTYESSQEGWLEDPIFYRNGEFMLGIVSHENEGILRVTEAEKRILEAEGFPFRSFGSYVGYG